MLVLLHRRHNSLFTFDFFSTSVHSILRADDIHNQYYVALHKATYLFLQPLFYRICDLIIGFNLNGLLLFRDRCKHLIEMISFRFIPKMFTDIFDNDAGLTAR